VKVPEFGKGEINNDYGQGFYCTKNKGLAGEWAVLWTGKDGYINEYFFDYADLTVLYLNQMPIENWIAVLVENRRGNYEEELQRRINIFLDMYNIDVSKYDVIEGWRADDAFFSYIEDFFTLLLSLEKLKEAMKFGDLGNQICLKSEKSFGSKYIKYTTQHPASAYRFYKSAQDRDLNAKRQYRMMRDKSTGTLLIDIIGRENL
jgi:hypothetical protein